MQVYASEQSFGFISLKFLSYSQTKKVYIRKINLYSKCYEINDKC